MELTGRRSRPTSMTDSRKARTARMVRSLLTAAALTAALGGCGSYVAGQASSANSTGNNSANSASTSSSASAAGCASVNQATRVTVLRDLHLVEPTRMAALQVTQTDPAKVRALFRDFCQVVTHKDTSGATPGCAMEIGLSYGGTFYDGNRPLASFTYAASGCQVVTVTAAGKGAKPLSAVVFGTAATAAPHLDGDMDRTLGLSDAQVFHPQTHINQGNGASK
jgi:hypothetical protein